MRNSLFSLIAMTVLGCGDQKFDQQGDIAYQRGGEACEDSKNHWLLDIKISNNNDSVCLNTLNLNRKVELHSLQLDSNTSLFQLLDKTCEGDSIDLRLSAATFYHSLGGSIPSYLQDSQQIKVMLWVRDKLDDIEHIAHKSLFESQIIAKFMQQLRWNGIQDSTTQIYYELLKTNPTGIAIAQKAKIKYILKTLDEKIIAYSPPDNPLVYDPNDKAILGGIRFLANKLKVGESARAVLPSTQAYGNDGNSKVAGYTPVLLELEVLELVH